MAIRAFLAVLSSAIPSVRRLTMRLTPLLLATLLLSGLPAARAAEAASLSMCDLFPESGAGERCGEFHIEHLDHPGGTMRTGRLDQVAINANMLTASGHGYRVAFTVQSRGSYLVLRIAEVVEPTPNTLMKLSFRLPSNSPFVLTRLDYMSVPHDDGKTMAWPWIWERAPEVGGQRSEVGSRRAEVGGRRSEDGRRRAVCF
jgi:hypothetical protein